MALSTHVVGLGREADDRLAGTLACAEVDEKVVRRLEDDLGDAIFLLELARRRRLRAEVGDGSGHHDDVGSAPTDMTASSISAVLDRTTSTPAAPADRRWSPA